MLALSLQIMFLPFAMPYKFFLTTGHNVLGKRTAASRSLVVWWPRVRWGVGSVLQSYLHTESELSIFCVRLKAKTLNLTQIRWIILSVCAL